MSTYAENPLIPWLLSHAYGQGGTVAVPSGTAGEMLGRFPPGIDDVLLHVASRHEAWTPATREIDWCFLVGGPGNGKSEALRYLASLLHVLLPTRVPSQPVPRTVPVEWPAAAETLPNGLELAFVNDASIPRDDVLQGLAGGSLFHDIADALRRTAQGRSTALLCNVNRGILVEEQSELLTAPPGQHLPSESGLAAAVIGWLAAPGEAPAGTEVVARPVAARPQYGQIRLPVTCVNGPHVTVCLHVVFLDVLSLLEPTPGGSQPVVGFGTSPPEVAAYATLGRLVSRDLTRDDTIAGSLLLMYADPARWQDAGCKDAASGRSCDAQPLCPFAQNARWLQEDNLRHRVLDVFRGAEVAAGRRLTYRDLLGHLSLAVLGQPRPEWLAGKHPCQWVADQHRQVLSGSGNKISTLDLARQRIYLNLYPGSGFEVARSIVEKNKLKGDHVFSGVVDLLVPAGEAARPQAFEAAFAEIDPGRDTDGWEGTRRRVLDAIESLDIVSPSEQLASWNQLLSPAVSEIERQLDRLLREELAAEMPHGTRAALTRMRYLRRWRAVALLRHVGTALARVRFANTIDAWLAEQDSALRDGQRQRLGDGLNNLIIPTRGRVYIAPFRPRTYCLSGDLPPDTLLVAVQSNELDVSLVPSGDTLVAEVRLRQRGSAQSDRLATLPIDLAVAREALLHAGDKGDSFTEIGDTAFARIERARASLIGRTRLYRVNLWFSVVRGSIFLVLPSPSSTHALRVAPARGTRDSLD